MRSIRSHIVIKYSPILDMGLIGRRIGARYLDDGEGKIENPGAGNERVHLYYPGRGYAIVFDWVSLSFYIEDGGDDLLDANGPTKKFFELLGEFERLDGFTELKSVETVFWHIAQEDDGAPATLKDFQSRFCSSTHLSTDSELTDLAVVVESRKGGRLRNFNLGPYRGEADFDKHKLRLFPARDRKGLFKLSGCLIKTMISSSDVKAFAISDFTFHHQEAVGLIEAWLSPAK